MDEPSSSGSSQQTVEDTPQIGGRFPRAAKLVALSSPNVSSEDGRVSADQQSKERMDSNDEMMSNEGDPDSTLTPLPPRGRKRRVGSPAGSGYEHHIHPPTKRGRGGGRGGGRGRGRRGAWTSSFQAPDQDEDDSSLFSVLRNGRAALRTVIDDWMEDYKQNPENALVTLLQFFISSSGCKGVMTVMMMREDDWVQVIQKLTEEFDEDSGDYPLMMPGPAWKKFKNLFCEFVSILIDKCKQEIIFDQQMMHSLISLLTGLADSQVRAFRHTSTLASMKVTTALVEVFGGLANQQEQNVRQEETEKQRQKRGGNTKLEFLLEKKQEIEGKLEEVRNMINYFFKSVFVHRYRDVLPDIRSTCISELGSWMNECPGFFLEDTYLKYLGWTLHDKVPEVRLKCLQALMPLYDQESLHQRLELFTNKFKERIVSMANDKDPDVAVQAVKLVTAILRAFPTVLTPKDCETVYDLVFSSHRGLAVSAGEFLNSKLFFPDEAAVRNLKTKKGKQRSLNTPLIRDLIHFFMAGTMHHHASYIVDALIDTNDMMKDWECMTDLLVEEPGRNEETLSDAEEKTLIDIVVCAVKQASTGEPPVARNQHKKYFTTNREREGVREEKGRITEHFIGALPLLLQKFIADTDKVVNLLLIPKYLELDMYTTGRQEKQLDSLLHLLEEIVERHTEDEVLLSVSSILETLTEEGLPIQGRAEKARSKLIDTAVLKLKQSIQQFHQEDEMDEEDSASLVASMRKVAALSECHDLAKWDLWDSVFSIIQPQDDPHKEVPAELKEKALKVCYCGISWDLAKLVEDPLPLEVAIEQLEKRRDDFIQACKELMMEPHVGDTAYLGLSDVLILFGWRLKERKEELGGLMVEVDAPLDDHMSRYCQDNVFNDEETLELSEEVSIERLYKRRKLLAAYSKLVLFGVVKIRSAADVFKQYVKYYNDFGDIIKLMMAKCRELNKIDSAKAVVQALTNMFLELQMDSLDGVVDPYSDGFMAIRDLAKRFALTFGPDPMRNREAVATIHRDGILLAVKNRGEGGEPPKNLAFLEIMMEFTNKLMKLDKKAVLGYLNKHIGGATGDGEEWQPLLLYKNSLTQGEALDLHAPPPPTGRGRPRKHKAPTPTPSEMDTDDY